jgi:hypothetical protein
MTEGMSVNDPIADAAQMHEAGQMKPWNMTVGILIGLLVGVLLWLGNYVPNDGIFQNPKLVIAPAIIAVLIVTVRNRRNKLGPYDPQVIARNKRGRM